MATNKWRNSVKTRDNWQCVICGEFGQFAHHIQCEAYFPELSNEIGNGVTLCKVCHGIVHRGKFGNTSKGKYLSESAIEMLKCRAISGNVYGMIERLVQADVDNSKRAYCEKRRGKN